MKLFNYDVGYLATGLVKAENKSEAEAVIRRKYAKSVDKDDMSMLSIDEIVDEDFDSNGVFETGIMLG